MKSIYSLGYTLNESCNYVYVGSGEEPPLEYFFQQFQKFFDSLRKDINEVDVQEMMWTSEYFDIQDMIDESCPMEEIEILISKLCEKFNIKIVDRDLIMSIFESKGSFVEVFENYVAGAFSSPEFTRVELRTTHYNPEKYEHLMPCVKMCKFEIVERK